jgi:hypothetical protein
LGNNIDLSFFGSVMDIPSNQSPENSMWVLQQKPVASVGYHCQRDDRRRRSTSNHVRDSLHVQDHVLVSMNTKHGHWESHVIRSGMGPGSQQKVRHEVQLGGSHVFAGSPLLQQLQEVVNDFWT